MTRYGAAQLTNAKFFGSAGMDSLSAMLRHANHYGLKYVFVHDPFYEPVLVFAGWRQVETFDSGEITVWSKDDAPPARKIPSDSIPPPWQGVLWGILPIGSAFLAIVSLLLLPEKVTRMPDVRPVPQTTPEAVYASSIPSSGVRP